MIIQRAALDSLLLNNVCEIRFVRRRPRSGDGPSRPKGPAKINEAAENVLVVWDILMQSYRTISMNSCDLIQQIPNNDFWEYFNENIYPMSPEQKYNFMNS